MPAIAWAPTAVIASLGSSRAERARSGSHRRAEFSLVVRFGEASRPYARPSPRYAARSPPGISCGHRAFAERDVFTLTQIQVLDVSPAAVWHLLVDTAGMPRWGPVRSVVIEKAGDGTSGDVGQIRAFRTWGGTFREQVTAADPERRLCYTLLSGAPVRDYRGTFTLEPAGSGTKLVWTVQVDPKWYVSPVLTQIVKRMMRRTMRGLSAEVNASRRS